MIRALAIGLLAATAMSTAAAAADLIVEESIAEVALAAYDWSGVYIGAQAGWGAGAAIINDGIGLVDEEVDISGGFVGVNASALAQFDGFVLGVEGQVNWSNISGVGEDLGGGNFLDSGVNWFGSIDLKAGVAADRALLYATAGIAAAEVSTGQDLFGTVFSNSDTAFGWTAGAGVDYAATDNVILGLQYRYYDFGDVDFDPPGGFTDRTQSTTLHTVAAKLSYKF
jgi:outer membrane immunogenic protein